MSITFEGTFELVVGVIDLDELKTYSEKTQEDLPYETDEEFYSTACRLGTIYSLGTFFQKINDDELDNLTNCYAKVFVIDCLNPETLETSVDVLDTLYVYSGAMMQR